MNKGLLVSSTKELFLRYGIKSVSMDDIARLLGISKKTIYAVINNKSELVEAVIADFIKEEEDTVNAIIKEAENAIDEITGIAAYVMQSLRKMKPTLLYDLKKYHPSAWAALEQDHFRNIERTIDANIKRGKQEGLYREDLDEKIQAKIYVGLSRLLVDEDTFPAMQYERAYLYKQMMMYHLNGIINEKGRTELKKHFNKKLE